MSRTQLPKPHRPHHDVPEEREQPDLPVEPDEGPIPLLIPDDPDNPELESLFDRAASLPAWFRCGHVLVGASALPGFAGATQGLLAPCAA
jgi:hypothetical protein